MLREFVQSRPAWLALGVIVGLGIFWQASRLTPPTPLYATATHSTENLTAATGFVDQDAEAVIYLDHVTGELNAYVINTNNYKLFAAFNYKAVNSDLGLANVKNPKYSLVTGVSNFKPSGLNRLAGCVVYVAEESSGQFVAYGMPWKGGAMAAGTPIKANFIKLATGKTSTAVRRAAEGAK
ncbi:MAG: hypothetical protein WD176_01670 [Pirellulales bacterium]